MACFLALETGGHLLNETGDGALLLEFCNDNQQATPGPATIARSSPHNGYSWEQTARILEQRRRKFAELKRQEAESERRKQDKESEIERLEKRRQGNLANQAMQIELMDMMRQMQAIEAERLAILQAIMIMRREEDDILAILYSLPFVL